MSLSLVIDLIIIVTLVLYAIDGYRRGFLLLFLELLGTILAFYLAIVFAAPIGQLVASYISIPQPLEKPIGFLALWFLVQSIYVAASSAAYPRLPEQIRDSLPNSILGLAPSVLKGLAMLAVILTLVVALPIQNQLRPAIVKSRIGNPLVTQTQKIQQKLTRRYSKEFSEALTFLTTTPLVPKLEQKGESLALHFTTTAVKVDTASEAEMLRLVNIERAKVGLRALKINEPLKQVAREHAKDMFARGYFSHDTPEGKDPFDRMDEAGIHYLTAGENLALAPTIELAHTGLMNSPKHKENILYPEFGQVGIGVIDGGIYGKMFVQEFRD